MKKYLISFILFFDRFCLRWIISVLLSLAGFFFKDGVKFVYYSNKAWIHYFKEIILCEPQPRLRNYHVKEIYNKYLWGFLYKPKKKDIIVDIGAGIGSETIFFSDKVGKFGKVFSVEAHPRIFKFLKRSIDLNSFLQTKAINLAVSNRNEKVFIENNTKDYLGNTIFSKNNAIEVQAKTIKDIAKNFNISKIDFLKINIEGAEMMALSGMGKLIKKTKYICVSCHDFKYLRTGNKFYRTKKKVKQFLLRNNFKILQRPKTKNPAINDQINAYNQNIIRLKK